MRRLGRSGTCFCKLSDATTASIAVQRWRSTLERSAHDPEVARFVNGSLEGIEEFFRNRLRAGVEVGEFRQELDPDSTAGLLLGLLAGVRVLARSRAEEALLNSIVHEVDRILR